MRQNGRGFLRSRRRIEGKKKEGTGRLVTCYLKAAPLKNFKDQENKLRDDKKKTKEEEEKKIFDLRMGGKEVGNEHGQG